MAYDRRQRDLPAGLWSNDPAGIVYHTTESHGAPFEAQQNQVLKRQGETLLEYIRDKQAYHYVIDRFGRVHRIVAESDSANHAGRSVWADARWVYLNLNSSFLGISFEGETQDLKEHLTPAQIHAGRTLTEMLRSRYRIAAENCVTHAQVSVNPEGGGWSMSAKYSHEPPSRRALPVSAASCAPPPVRGTGRRPKPS